MLLWLPIGMQEFMHYDSSEASDTGYFRLWTTCAPLRMISPSFKLRFLSLRTVSVWNIQLGPVLRFAHPCRAGL